MAIAAVKVVVFPHEHAGVEVYFSNKPEGGDVRVPALDQPRPDVEGAQRAFPFHSQTLPVEPGDESARGLLVTRLADQQEVAFVVGVVDRTTQRIAARQAQVQITSAGARSSSSAASVARDFVLVASGDELKGGGLDVRRSFGLGKRSYDLR